MEQAVVLGCGDGKLQYFADEKGRDRATTPSLCFQGTDTGNGHIVGKVQGTEPIHIAIEDGRTKAIGAVVPAIAINLRRPLQEQLPITEEKPMVIEIVDVDFKTPAAHLV